MTLVSDLIRRFFGVEDLGETPDPKPFEYPWYECFDDDDNSGWELTLPYVDTVIHLRIRVKVYANRLLWWSDHDAEMSSIETWDSLEEAKRDCERYYDYCLNSD
jgi:hypothetical protein